MKKTYSKTGTTCRVTFEVPSEVEAELVALCGDFNNWDSASHLLKQRKDGRFTLTVSLEAGQSYRYRYLLDGEQWENDWNADAYQPNEFGTEDSILTV
jgi:1,4-alpha-glucan branching enzyme